MEYTKSEIISWLNEIEKGVISLHEDNIDLAHAARLLIEGEEPSVALKPGYLSPHFTMFELIYSDTAQRYMIDNAPNESELIQLTDLANRTLEGIRSICGDEAVTITSGFRCKELNSQIGGASNSAHLYGCAADLVIPDYGSPNKICKAIIPHMKELEIDQLIDECDSSGNRWVHVGRAIPPNTVPRYQQLTVNANGSTTSGIA